MFLTAVLCYVTILKNPGKRPGRLPGGTAFGGQEMPHFWWWAVAVLAYLAVILIVTRVCHVNDLARDP